jgi:tRNA 2-thiouridine synthesizing protein A
MPILRTKQALSKMGSGQKLHVMATDPGSVKDFDAFCRATGNVLEEAGEADGEFHYLVRKA